MKKFFALAIALVIATAASAGTATAESDAAIALRSAVSNENSYIMTENIALDSALEVKRNFTLDLNGHTLSRSSSKDELTFVIIVTNEAELTIEDNSTSKEGEIISTNSHNNSVAKGFARGIKIGDSAFDGSSVGTGGSVIMNGGTIIADPDGAKGQSDECGGYGVSLYGNNSLDKTQEVKVSFTMNGGEIQAGWVGVFPMGLKSVVTINNGTITGPGYAISGNGATGDSNCGGTVIDIKGGIIESTEDVAIYHPQSGELNIYNGATIRGLDGIQMKSGTINIYGGTITATGKVPEGDYPTASSWTPTGAALSLMSQTGGYAGDIKATIDSGTLTSTNGNAVIEGMIYKESETPVNKFTSLTVNGGEIIGAADTEAIAMTNATARNTTITDGTFSSDLRNLAEAGVNIPEMQLVDGKYVVVKPETTTTGGGGGGCSAGFGALALLAALPLFRMRRK